MSGSYVFLFHLFGFGLLAGMFTVTFVVERRFRQEKDWTQKAYAAAFMNSLVILGPVSFGLLILTGIGNIYNRYLGSPEPWYHEGWLVWKIVLFVLMIVNGALTGRILSTKRMQLVRSAGSNPPPEAERTLTIYNRGILIFNIFQVMLLAAIVYLAVFGGAKHPGVF